jgi:16S rRNA G966 N2-methylase RsmD
MDKILEVLTKEETKNFIRDHINEDVNQLILNPPSTLGPSFKEIITQILSRQKARKKLPEWASNYDLVLPPPLSIEQASSDQAAEYKNRLISGHHLVDLTGGMGIDTLALSTNFKQTTYVEQQEDLAHLFRHNCDVLDQPIDVVSAESSAFLSSLSDSQTRVFYLDPARRDEHKNKVFRLEDCSPNLLDLMPLLEQKGGQVLIKLSPYLDIKLILNRIQHVKELHVVSIKNDCKELLILIDFHYDGEPVIKTINMNEENEEFEFSYKQEKSSKAQFSELGKFLLEPNASILKAGGFNALTHFFDVRKLHSNTHLYTTDNLIVNWPGRTFEIIEAQVNKKKLQDFAPKGRINVVTRNHPLSADALKKKFKITDGGDYFLIGFRDLNQKAQLIFGRKL